MSGHSADNNPNRWTVAEGESESGDSAPGWRMIDHYGKLGNRSIDLSGPAVIDDDGENVYTRKRGAVHAAGDQCGPGDYGRGAAASAGGEALEGRGRQ